jgi:dolichol-phosphate mannosyltransferase
MSKSFTILVPVFNEISALKSLEENLILLSNNISNVTGGSVKVLFIDNYSTDTTFIALERIILSNKNWSAIQLVRNYGVQSSLLFGMSQVSTDGLLVFQSDMQDPIDVALKLVEEWTKGKRVVAGVTVKRSENIYDVFSRRIFYKVLTKSSDFGLLPWLHDFYVLDKEVYSQLYRKGFSHELIRGRIAEEFGVDSIIEYKRFSRKTGKSSFNFAKKYQMALDGILKYGSRIPRVFSICAFVLATLSSVAIFSIFFSWMIGFRSPVQGWLSLVCILLTILSIFGFGFSIIIEFLFRLVRIVNATDVPIARKQING